MVSAPVAAVVALWTVIVVLRAGGALRRGGAFVFTLAVAAGVVYVAAVAVDLARGHNPFAATRRATCLVVLVSVPLVFDVGSVDTFNVARFSLVLLAAVVIVVTWAAEALVSRRPVAWRTGLQLPLAGLLAWMTLATATGLSPRASLVGAYGSYDGLLALVAFGVVFTAVAGSFSVADVRRFLAALWYVAGGLIGLYGLLQLHDRLTGWGGRWDWINWREAIIVENAIWSTLGNPNHLGAAIAILLPVGITVMSTAGSVRERVVVAVIGLPLVAQLVYASSAGAWLAALVSLPVTALVLGPEVRVQARTAAVGAAGLGAVVVATALALGSAGGLAEQVGSIFDTSGTTGQRLGYWEAAATMVPERPLLGLGPDTYHLRFAKHQSAEFVAKYGAALQVNGPHNLLLNWVVGGGVPALVLFVGLVTLAGLRAFGAWRRMRRHEADARGDAGAHAAARTSRLVLAGLAGGIVAYLVQGSFNVQQIALSLLFWGLLGALVVVTREVGVPDSLRVGRLLGSEVTVPSVPSEPLRRSNRDQIAPVAGALAVGVVGLVLCAQALRPYRADRHYFAALRWQATADFLEDRDPGRAPRVRQRAVSEFSRAADLNPWEATFPAARARAFYALGHPEPANEQARGARRTLLLASASTYKEALGLAPGSWRLLNSYAEAFIRLSEIDPGDKDAVRRAEVALRRSMTTNPRHARSTLLLALLLEKQGRSSDAAEVVDQSLRLLPKSPELLRLGAQVRGRSGDGADAQALWRRLLAVVPGDPEAEKELTIPTGPG